MGAVKQSTLEAEDRKEMLTEVAIRLGLAKRCEGHEDVVLWSDDEYKLYEVLHKLSNFVDDLPTECNECSANEAE